MRNILYWIVDNFPAGILITGIYLFGRLEYAIEFAPLA